jgi:hypothetical protein
MKMRMASLKRTSKRTEKKTRMKTQRQMKMTPMLPKVPRNLAALQQRQRRMQEAQCPRRQASRRLKMMRAKGEAGRGCLI